MLHAISKLLGGEAGAAVTKDIADNWPKMPEANAAKVFERINDVMKEPKKSKKIRKGKGKPTKPRNFKGKRHFNDSDIEFVGAGTRLTGKLGFAIQSTLFRDILTTILKYGMNPVVTYVGAMNHKLNLLVK